MCARKPVSLHPKQARRLLTDAEKSAAFVNLVYISDQQAGILRKRAGKGFSYSYLGKLVRDPALLDRIRKLVIPPAWKQVWICPDPRGHLQATGIDAMGRKQYRYHPLWTQLRNHTKFFQLLEFGKALPRIRTRIADDMKTPGLSREKVLASLVSIMEQTSIRIGSAEYERRYGSYGLSTLKNHHAEINGNQVLFRFKGKKGISHTITLRNPKLARILGQCRDLPGKDLFEYIGDDGTVHPVDSGMVNDYIREASGGPFTAKDFRTWSGTLQCLECLYRTKKGTTETETRRQVLEAIDHVAACLGNTRAVCRKYYIHPLIPELFERGELRQQASASPDPHYSDMEWVLLTLLERKTAAVNI